MPENTLHYGFNAYAILCGELKYLIKELKEDYNMEEIEFLDYNDIYNCINP